MDNDTPIKCTCQDCGKTFVKGSENDNEKFCLRCERISERERWTEDEVDRHEMEHSEEYF